MLQCRRREVAEGDCSCSGSRVFPPSVGATKPRKRAECSATVERALLGCLRLGVGGAGALSVRIRCCPHSCVSFLGVFWSLPFRACNPLSGSRSRCPSAV
eukprot:ctg_877.g369